jgi:hypothetical protein
MEKPERKTALVTGSTDGVGRLVGPPGRPRRIPVHNVPAIIKTKSSLEMRAASVSAAPPHRDGLCHPPFKLLLAVRERRHSPEMLRSHDRGRPWEKRVRCGIAIF